MEIEERLLDAINEFELAAKGSLWFVKDNVWKNVISGFVVKRKAHPGLVFQNKRYDRLNDIVPMMIGTSKNCHGSSGFKAEGVMSESKNAKHCTFFKVIRQREVNAPDEETLAVSNFTGFSCNIQRNMHKPRLNEEEMEALENYLEKKGFSHEK